jgi:DNA gyrase inhibitor GyrI
MSELDVRIVKLDPMRVASAHGFGPNPEELAWKKLVDWAKPRGLLADLESHRIFGFNNPNPSASTPNYGYELWIVVGPEVEAGDGIEIKEFAGGLYGVARCKPKTGEEIGEAWQELVKWLEASPYDHARHQWLEEHIVPGGIPESGELAVGEFELDLYAPIAK